MWDCDDCETCDLREECSLAPDFAPCLKEQEAAYIAEVEKWCLEMLPIELIKKSNCGYTRWSYRSIFGD